MAADIRKKGARSRWRLPGVCLCAALFLACASGVFGCGDGATGRTALQDLPGEAPVRCVPEIDGDAFRKGTAVTLLKPEPRSLNDHCIFRDLQGRFHLLAIDGGAPWEFHNSLAHGVGDRLDAPMVRLADVLPAASPECTIWAPFGVIREGRVRLFYTDAHYCEPGPVDRFAMNLATADARAPSEWVKEGVLFWERGFVRDPHVIWEPGERQWVMYFNRKIEPYLLCGPTAVSFKVSQDLVHGSEQTWDVIGGILYGDPKYRPPGVQIARLRWVPVE